MTIEKFKGKMIEGGWSPERPIFEVGDEKLYEIRKEAVREYVFNEHEPMSIHEILLDPKAWEAVGKVEGWGICDVCSGEWDSCYTCGGKSAPKRNMYRMLDALWEGKTIEDFIKTL